ncbi:hypothetical protein [Mycobacterium sp.]|jgi:hypothetical protein|uniref:hypothetical protein n=1 Tax=Mycobacterium sp. TaxID=1785 RepID=UPI002D2BEE48|nr:hypothetical protein [Mycobacterium sp.]HZA11331.1 hypothetical protein [Mycobacterium sp.]
MQPSTGQPAAGAIADRSSRTKTPDTAAPGWVLNFIAGFVPLVAGLTTLLSTWSGVARANSAWWTGLGTLDFSYSSLSQAGRDAPAWVQLTGSVGAVNIVAGGVAVIVVARFGLRGGQRWAWWFLAFCFVWVGLHDATMATRFFTVTGQPFMLLPCAYWVLMLAGLLRSRRAIFAAAAAVPDSTNR